MLPYQVSGTSRHVFVRLLELFESQTATGICTSRHVFVRLLELVPNYALCPRGTSRHVFVRLLEPRRVDLMHV